MFQFLVNIFTMLNFEQSSQGLIYKMSNFSKSRYILYILNFISILDRLNLGGLHNYSILYSHVFTLINPLKPCCNEWNLESVFLCKVPMLLSDLTEGSKDPPGEQCDVRVHLPGYRLFVQMLNNHQMYKTNSTHVK